MSQAKTATISVRVEPEAKEAAEKVFRALGISTSSAINIFFRQVAMRQNIPFSLEIPAGPPELDISHMSREELVAELMDIDSGMDDENSMTLEELTAKINEELDQWYSSTN